ncbi:MAG: ribonuclease Z [Eubacterium sp.]|nr:ribonuclease Z [Eubacterium sp.]
MLDICLLGTGGMMPLPQRFLTSLLARYNGSSLLIDCGEGTQITLKKNGWSFKSIDTICFTHYHADHISGLPGILLAMANSDRTEPLTMIGPKGLNRVVTGLRVIAPELPFPIRLLEITEREQVFEQNGYRITAFRVQHNMICYGYKLEILRCGRFDVERAREQGIPLRFWNPLQKGETIEDGGRVYTPDMVLGADRKGLKVVYCTDSRPAPVIAAQAEGADLFICEGMYGDEEKEEKAMEHRHMTVYEAASLAAKAKPAELWLTHYSPSMMHPEWYLKKIRKIFPAAELGEDGKYRELRFEE